MSTSGTVSATVFDTNRVVDHAFRRCRLRAQQISSEMQSYARDSLYLFLSRLANTRTPSWCIERQVYPFYEGQARVTLATGTVEVLNANYRILQELSGATVTAANSFTLQLSSAAAPVSVGVKWSGASPTTMLIQHSDDNVAWTTNSTVTPGAAAGEWTWFDLSAPTPHVFWRVASADPLSFSRVYWGALPQEIPMGVLNKDTYTAQSNKSFPGRPIAYWFQRDHPRPVMNLWPAPNDAAEFAQLIVWRHRHVMDVGPLSGEVEVPQRWMEAIIDGLAARMAAETPEVDAKLIPVLEARAAQSLREAWDGDNDGSPTYIQPRIAAYTR